MAKKPSQRQYLLSSPKRKALYFYVKNGVTFLIPFLLCTSIHDKGYVIFSYILFLPLVFVFYRYISHYIALIIVFLETMLNGGR